MIPRIDKERLKLFVRIGTLFLLLSILGDLISNKDYFLQRIINNVWRCSYVVVVNFILFEYTLPSLRFTWRRVLLGLLLLWGHLMLYSFGLFAWRHIGIQLEIFTALTTYPTTDKGLESQMGFSVGSIVFFGISRHIYDYIRLKQAAQQLRIEKQEAELSYLKAQTNPHFLFNTLNNIYSLSRDKSDLAPESILRLSKILRFMLYEATGAYIAVEKELRIISDYIALEKLRYDDSLLLNFNYDIEDMHQALPPLLLIPLVENAFKHGVSETRQQPFVDIHLSIKQRQLSFKVRNSAEAVEPGMKENIGLSNLRRQLALLYTDYDLSIQPCESDFTATLKINLASHV